MRKTFLKLFVKASLPFIMTGAAFAAGETSPAQESAAPAAIMPTVAPSAEAPPPQSGILPPPDSAHGTGISGIHDVVLQDAAHGAAGHAASSGLPQMDPTWFPSQIFWLAVTFAGLYVIFARKVLPDLSRTLENRRNQIQGDLDTAQNLKDEAESVHQAYEAILNEAKEKCSSMFIKVDEEIKKKTAKKMDGFALRAAKDMRDTEESIEEAKKAALGDMNTIAAEIASLAAQKIIGMEPDLDQAKTVVKKLGLKAA